MQGQDRSCLSEKPEGSIECVDIEGDEAALPVMSVDDVGRGAIPEVEVSMRFKGGAAEQRVAREVVFKQPGQDTKQFVSCFDA